MVDQTPFTSMDKDFGAFFTSGVSNAVSSALSFVAGPLTATVVLWIIVQGILVMRGDIDTRSGITRIIKVALVVGLVTSSTGYFSTYVQQLFVTNIPSWAAQAAGGGNGSVTSTPGTFDALWTAIQSYISQVGKQLDSFDVANAVALAVIWIGTMIILVVTFAVYEFSIIVMGIVVAIGPVLLLGYLFEATKGFVDRWIGQLVTYSLLILLIDVTLNIVVNGEKTYCRTLNLSLQGGGSGGGSYAVQTGVVGLLELLAFLLMGGFIILSLPALAASIGGGHGGGPAHAITNAFNSVGGAVSSSVGGGLGRLGGVAARGAGRGARRLMGAGPKK